MAVFLASRRFLDEPREVRDLIIEQHRFHTTCGDKSERFDVRTILEAALPPDLRDFLDRIRKKDLGPELNELLDKIAKEKVTNELIEQRLALFKRRIHLEALLPTCCACGIRDDYVLKEDLETLNTNRKQRGRRVVNDPAEVPDLFEERPVKSSYVKVNVMSCRV
jgi:hypothetical protein